MPGVLRIAGHARYPNTAGSAAAVAGLLGPLCRLPGHQFWADDLSLLERTRVDATRLLGSAQITGTCLLALACEHGARLASFDRRLVTDAVRDGAAHLHLIE